MRRVSLVLLLMSLVAAPRLCLGDAASIGMADAYHLSARGVEAPFFNPATLGWSAEWSASVGGGSLTLGNNTYDVDDYRRWNGARWSDEDREQILAKIEDANLEGQFEVHGLAPGVAWRGFALTIETIHAGRVEIPREYAELALFGNLVGESYELGPSEGQRIEFGAIQGSYGHVLGTLSGIEIAAGANLRFLLGNSFDELEDSRGFLETSIDELDGTIQLDTRTAEGGRGYGFDLGLVARGAYELQFGVSMKNLLGTIHWEDSPRLRTDRLVADSLSVQGLEEDEIELITTEERVETIPSFSRSLPRELSVAVARPFPDAFLEAGLTIGFGNSPRTSVTPRLAVGAAYLGWKYFIGRAGLALGGLKGTTVAIGGGVEFRRFRLDIGYQSLGSAQVFLPKGAAGSLSLSYGLTRRSDQLVE